jgi:two-component system, NarL family, sensor histidine kinase UhpB
LNTPRLSRDSTLAMSAPFPGAGATLPLTEQEVSFADVPFRGIVEQALAGVYVVLDERFMYANDTFAAMFGYERSEFIGTRMADVVLPEALDEVMRNYRLRISGEVAVIRYLTQCRHRNGQVVHLELHASRVICRGRPALAGVAIDITERVQREQDLRRSREQLRELALHLNTVREEQRTALARDVHDMLGGMLTSIKMDVTRIVRRAGAPELGEIRGIATELVALVQETIDTARRISDELRPAALDAQGLQAALRDTLQRFGIRHDVSTELDADAGDPDISPAKATQCYRIFQEALTNVARHAQARKVTVSLRCTGGAFRMQVADDGRGIGPEPSRQRSIGLFSMAERAREIGGTLEVLSEPQRGTAVLLRVPMNASLPPASRDPRPADD